MTYNYSATQNNGRITGSVDGATGESTTYSYGALNRLTSAANGLWGETYGYDGFGNLTSKAGTGGAPSMSASFDVNNHQVGGSYDGNGNQTSANGSSNGFSVENRLNTQSAGVWPYASSKYGYDPNGKRVMKRVDPDPNGWSTGSSPNWEFYFYGITGQRLVTVGCSNPYGNPQPTCAVTGQNVYYGSKLLVSNGVNVVTDRLGSVRANTQGEHFSYYPYGEERTSTVDGRDKFGTYFRDAAGQDYAEQRYYGAGTGRFWSPDALAGRTADPGSLNRYAYVQGDPINFGDPTGRLTCSLDGIGIGCDVMLPECGYSDFSGFIQTGGPSACQVPCSDKGSNFMEASASGCGGGGEGWDPEPARRTYFLVVTKDCYDVPGGRNPVTREIDYQVMFQEADMSSPMRFPAIITEHLTGDLPNSGSTSSGDIPGVYDDSQSVLSGKSAQTLTQTFTANISGVNVGVPVMGAFRGNAAQLNIVKHVGYVSINGDIGGKIDKNGKLVKGSYTPCN